VCLAIVWEFGSILENEPVCSSAENAERVDAYGGRHRNRDRLVLVTKDSELIPAKMLTLERVSTSELWSPKRIIPINIYAGPRQRVRSATSYPPVEMLRRVLPVDRYSIPAVTTYSWCFPATKGNAAWPIPWLIPTVPAPLLCACPELKPGETRGFPKGAETSLSESESRDFVSVSPAKEN
jgi:hypothetical protein